MIAHADNVTLADVRTSVIASGVIPDTYLIEPTGTYWESQNVTAIYNFIKTWTEDKDESVPSSLFQNKVNRALFNTATLLEGRVDSLHQVAALVTAKERALGTYNLNTTEYLKKYHDYIISNHNIPNTVNGIDTALGQALGDMTPLAGEITSITNRAASIGGVPTALLEQDVGFWVDTELSTYCQLDGDTGNPYCNDILSADVSAQQVSSVHMLLYWRAFSCLSSYGGISYGAVCSDTSKWFAQPPWTGSISSKTVTGNKVYSRLTVTTTVLTEVTANLKINANGGDRGSDSDTKTGSGVLKLEATAAAWANLNDHPCYDIPPDEWPSIPRCVAETTWTFNGGMSVSPFTRPDPPNTDLPRDTNPNTNRKPDIEFAIANPSIVDHGKTVKLSGYAEDPDGDTVTFSWSQVDPGDDKVQLMRVSSTVSEFTAPDKRVDLTFRFTATDNHGSSASQTVTISVDDRPTLEVEPTFLRLVKYVGLFHEVVAEDGGIEEEMFVEPVIEITVDDKDSINVDIRVYEPPPADTAALANCDTLYSDSYKLYQARRDVIYSGPSEYTTSVCLVALNITVTDGPLGEPQYHPHSFTLDAYDETSPVHQQVKYEIRNPLSFTEILQNSIGVAVPDTVNLNDAKISWQKVAKGSAVQSALDELVSKGIEHLRVEYWRCEYHHAENEEYCDVFDFVKDVLQLQTESELGRSETPSNTQPQFNINQTEWTRIARTTDTGTITDPYVVLDVNMSDVSTASTARDTTDSTTPANLTLYDYGIDPDTTYVYAMRLIGTNITSDYIPLGQITTPADTTPPEIVLSEPTNMTIPQGTPYAEPGYYAVDDYDDILTANVTVTGTVDTSTPGTYKLYYDVSDGSGNAAVTQNRTVHVADSTPPVITLKGQQAMTVEGRTTYVEPGYIAIDNVDGNVTDMVVVSGMVDTTILDTYTLRYDVSDSVGNAATQSRTVTVVDTTPPIIMLIDGAEITIPASVPYMDPGYEAIDGMDGNITDRVKVVGTVNVDAQGLYQILYIVADSSGNLADTMIRNVIVTDITPPVITLKGGSEVWVTKGMTYIEPGYTAIDNIDGNVTGMVVVTGMVDASVEGTYTLHYDITDRAGNAATTQNRTVTVTASDASPVITLKGQRAMTIEEGTTYAEPGYAATDHEDGNLTANVTITGTVDATKIGTYTIYYDVSDSFGNAAIQQTRTVHVVDVTPPAITLAGPTDMTIPVNSTYAEPGYTATDNYDGDLTGKVVVTGTVDTVRTGTYTLYYDVVDSSGNTAVQQSRTVHVGDVMPPTITLAGPTDMTIQVNSAYAEPGYVAADDYDEDLTSSVIVTGTVDATKIGTYTIYYDVADSSGNQATQQVRTVHVVAATPPTITLSGSSTVTVPFASAYSEPGYTATDPEDGDLTSSVIVTGMVDTTTTGTYRLYYDVADRFGNKAVQQTRTVHVVDVMPPTITLAGQTNMTVSVNTTYADPGYTAADDYDGDLTGKVVVTGTVDATKIGTYMIYYDVTDSSGNRAIQQVRTVHVEAVPDPQAGLPEVVKRYDADRNGSIDYQEWQRAISDYANGLLTAGELYTISAARSYG